MTPARIRCCKLGDTAEDQIVPPKPGFSVLATTFAGDHREQPNQPSPADILEHFYVLPTVPAVPVLVIRQFWLHERRYGGERVLDRDMLQTRRQRARDG